MDIPSLYQIFLSHPVVNTDTRQITPGSIFFALRGDHFDGNAFALQALEEGAAYAVVSDATLAGPGYILVEDTLATLQQLAAYHRSQLSIPVIGITGSNGKTTTKELLAAVLSKKYRIHATKGNLNNHIGVPLTLLQVKPDIEILICEMGANHVGEIKALCEIAQPTHGLITNIGKAHLEGFGSFEGVKKAKGELFEYLAAHDGTAFVNEDDPAVVENAACLPYGTIPYSLKENVGGYHFSYQADQDHNGFYLRDEARGISIHSNLFGPYNAMNMLAAYTVGNVFRVGQFEMVDALENFISGSNRSEVIRVQDCTVVKDAYNANPSSMELALEAFAVRYPKGWVVLGDMKELGSTTSAAHQHIVALALSKQFEKIVFVGNAFQEALQHLASGDSRILSADNIETIKLTWDWHPLKGKALLLKGSRSMHLEKLLEA